MNRNFPIGVFDSGVGGLTVLSEMIKILPNENFIYFGDTKRAPYGEKSPEIIIEYAKQICKFLVSKNVKAIVTACNTESAYALSDMKKWLDIPVIGVIESAVEEAVKKTKNKKIGIIATKATILSGVYQNMIRDIDKEIEVFAKFCPKFVPYIESGKINTKEFDYIIEKDLLPYKEEGIDTLILGCTHYPLIKNNIQNVLGSNVNLIDPSKNTAISLYKILKENDLYANNVGDNQYYASKMTDFMKKLIKEIDVKSKDIIIKEL